MAYIEQKNRLAPTWEQAFKNCIEFMSNLLGLSWLELGDVELYIQNVDLFMLIHWTHNSEKGENFYFLTPHIRNVKIICCFYLGGNHGIKFCLLF